MAEPLDYFFQGANLGMNAAQFGARQRQDDYQFRTNLAERARQFDLENEIRRDTLELNRDQYSMDLEKHQLAQKASKLAIRNARMDVQRQQRELDEDEKWAPAVYKFNDQLQAAGPMDEIPQLPAEMPQRIREQLGKAAQQHFATLRSTRSFDLAQKRDAMLENRYNDDVAFLLKHNANLLTPDKFNTGKFTYDQNALLALRKQVSDAEKEAESRKLDAEIAYKTRYGSTSTKSETDQRREWREKNYNDESFYDLIYTDPEGNAYDEPKKVFNNKRFKSMEDRVFGKTGNAAAQPRPRNLITAPEHYEQTNNDAFDPIGSPDLANRLYLELMQNQAKK